MTQLIALILSSIPAIMFVAALIAALLAPKSRRFRARLLDWMLLLSIGISYVWAGFFHVFFPELAARSIGWAVAPSSSRSAWPTWRSASPPSHRSGEACRSKPPLWSTSRCSASAWRSAMSGKPWSGRFRRQQFRVAAVDHGGANDPSADLAAAGLERWELGMTITITAFERAPDRGRGLARDMRVRWALEEVGQPYGVRLLSFEAMKQPAHLDFHPFGRPTFEDGDLALFGTGAIVFHIAQRFAGLLPDEPDARARAITWMFAALSTVEPPIVERESAMLMERKQPWYEARLPILDDRVRKRLAQLSDRLGGDDWLDGAFSAGDLLMVTVLRRLDRSPILKEYPNLLALIARAKRGRPISAPSPLNWRCSPAAVRKADRPAIGGLSADHEPDGIRNQAAAVPRNIASFS